MQNLIKILFFLFFSLFAATFSFAQKNANKEVWKKIFNGKNLDGWDIKIAQHPLNENFKNNFRVDSGILRVSYDGYKKFDNQFGHLYYKTLLSYYKVRMQYRFLGNHLPDAPEWGNGNSGIMVHSQSAKSVNFNQNFPVSLEIQLLGGLYLGKRTTGNVCTPGTQVSVNGVLRAEHCIDSKSKFYDNENWVNIMVEVYGDSLIRSTVEGENVLEFQKPIIGGGFVGPDHTWTTANILDSISWINKEGTPLTQGYLALQAESQNIDFRNIELLNLEGCMDPTAKNYKAYYIKSDKTKCKY